LLSGFIKDLDVNFRGQAVGKKMTTAMHLAVEQNDYDALKLILEYTGEPRREVGLKDANGKNPMDLAADLDFTSMKDLLQKHGGH
jgi:ankyrin repeat protein